MHLLNLKSLDKEIKMTMKLSSREINLNFHQDQLQGTLTLKSKWELTKMRISSTPRKLPESSVSPKTRIYYKSSLNLLVLVSQLARDLQQIDDLKMLTVRSSKTKLMLI